MDGRFKNFENAIKEISNKTIKRHEKITSRKTKDMRNLGKYNIFKNMGSRTREMLRQEGIEENA